MSAPFEQHYPQIARWVKTHGWIEVGDDEMSPSFIRALDIGGMIWEGQAHYATVDDALQALEAGLAAWMRDQLGE
jgi:hypothetical protein